jgi:hypothetical protein
LGSREGREGREGREAREGARQQDFRAAPSLVPESRLGHFRSMFDRYARRLRRRALLEMKLGDSVLRGELAKPLLAFALSALAAQGLGADEPAVLLLLALPCAAWGAFIVRHWWTVYRRFRDRHYHLFTKKILSKEYRQQPSPYDGRQK